MYNNYCQTPIGTVQIQATDKGICRLTFVDRPAADVCRCDLIERCIDQLNSYFSHGLLQFSLPLDLVGAAFQHAVWKRLLAIPYGVTRSYRDIANDLHKPRAMRAVGGACAHNPVAIIVPCHRVVASNGRLVGYAAGLERKDWLLRHEVNTRYGDKAQAPTDTC